MTKSFDNAAAFIATADSRETSVEIMRAIAHISRDMEEAVRIWEFADDRELVAIIEIATRNGIDAPEDFHWGAAGNSWAII